MKIRAICVLGAMLISGAAAAQEDLVLMLNPFVNEQKVIVRSDTMIVPTQEDRTTGTDFHHFEQQLALRYAIIQNEERELYFTFDTHVIEIGTGAIFDETFALVPDGLYDVGFGAIYRQTVKEDWRVGGQLRVGSASDKPFDSAEELYVRGLGFLQIPHLEHTSWLAVVGVNSDWQIPVIPGFGYVFPLSEQSLAVVGFPFIGAAGQLTERIGFQLLYWPLRNANARVSYNVTERIAPYTGFRWRANIFSREARTDDRDRLVFEDKRVFVGTIFDLTERIALDVQTGYLFDRQIGEGDDFGDQQDNDVHIGNSWYGNIQFSFTF